MNRKTSKYPDHGRTDWLLALALLGMGCAILPVKAAVMEDFLEDFSSNPLSLNRSWQVAGEESLFAWNPSEEILNVTWDSSRSNSFFYLPLGTTLTRGDQFSVSFDLVLQDVVTGLAPDKPFTFEIALGFIHLESARQESFRRGISSGVKNILEFNYFPAFSIYAPTVALTMVSSDRVFAFSHNFPLPLRPGEYYHVDMAYGGSTSELSAMMLNDGESVPLESAVASGSFGDFQVDAFAISSYSDDGADGSILAHGKVDNVRLRFPAPPVRQIAGGWDEGQWRVTFDSQTNWTYYLERTSSFESWETLSGAMPGNGSALELVDHDPPERGFYRVRAERP